jgi:hypothetical protein
LFLVEKVFLVWWGAPPPPKKKEKEKEKKKTGWTQTKIVTCL